MCAISLLCRRLICYFLGHDVHIEVPARSLVSLWCGRCGKALYQHI